MKSKFKVGDIAYKLSFTESLLDTGVLSKANISLVEVHITAVKGKCVDGFHFERYGHIMDYYPHKERNIYTKKNKRKGKEIPWTKNDMVALTIKYNTDNLLTLEEAKMKMIQYIANDFNDEICIGCTCHQDESY